MNIVDIAKMAGVSSAAVSPYFNNGHLSEKNRRQYVKSWKKQAIVLLCKHRH